MNHFIWLLLVSGSLFLGACNATKHVPEGKLLHNVTQVNVKSKQKVKRKADLKLSLLNLTRPKPNVRMLGLFKFKLGVYNVTKNAKKGMGNWLLRRLGEPPILIDSLLLERSTGILQNYLFGKGYFYNKVRYRTTTKNDMATVNYDVRLSEPYKIDQLFFPSDSSNQIHQLIQATAQKTVLKQGQQFDVDLLQAERDRIAAILRNQGYYDFNKSFVVFRLDSSKNNRLLNVYFDIKKPKSGGEHQIYKIKNVYINSEYFREKKNAYYTDTLLIDGYHYISPTKKRFRTKMITDFLLIKKDALYSQQNYDYALNHLYELDVFKFVDIRFEEAKDSTFLDKEKKYLNCYIYLTPKERMALTVEAGINNQSSQNSNDLLGTSITLGYKNKNIFKGAEAFSFDIYNGVEFDLSSSDNLNNRIPYSLINTFEVGGEVKLKVPKFLSPFKINNLSRYYRPQTSISLRSNYIDRVNLYRLISSSAVFGYDWRENRRKKHTLNPISIALVSLPTNSITSNFRTQLEQNPILAQSFEEQFIISSNYSFVYNNQNLNELRNFIFFRGNIELAGNTTYLFDQFLQETGLRSSPLNIFGNKYSQYIRLEADLRHYNIIDKHRSFVTRIFMGLGVPYLNSNVLPYAKQFFVGGSQSVRAFDIRSIGPGSFAFSSADSTNTEFDRTGDIKLEANAEYRFDITGYFKGAVFVDAGNVWLLRQTAQADDSTAVYREGGSFKADKFLGQLGVGVGLGLRMDFSYFVFRFDFAAPFRNPTLPKNRRWVVNDWGQKGWWGDNLAFRIALGYPF